MESFGRLGFFYMERSVGYADLLIEGKGSMPRYKVHNGIGCDRQRNCPGGLSMGVCVPQVIFHLN